MSIKIQSKDKPLLKITRNLSWGAFPVLFIVSSASIYLVKDFWIPVPSRQLLILFTFITVVLFSVVSYLNISLKYANQKPVLVFWESYFETRYGDKIEYFSIELIRQTIEHNTKSTKCYLEIFFNGNSINFDEFYYNEGFWEIKSILYQKENCKHIIFESISYKNTFFDKVEIDRKTWK